MASAAVSPQAGYWWNPAEGGRGYGIEVQGGSALIAGYMHAADGTPVWYLAANAMTGTTFAGTWGQFKDGAPLYGSYRAAAVANANVGPLTVQFSSSATGTLTLPDGRQVPIQRFRF